MNSPPLLIKWIFAGCFMIMVHHPGIAQEMWPQPVDSSFFVFADTLSRAIEKDDTTFVFRRVDEDVFNGFGGSGGIEEFKSMWRSRYQRLGEELQKALALGPAYDEDLDRIYLPYLWITFPDTLDAFRYGYPLKEEVPVYGRPEVGTAVLDTLPQRWIEVFSWFEGDSTDPYGDPLWVGVTTASADTGYVQNEYIRSLIDYRFWFEKENNKWILMGWAAGD